VKLDEVLSVASLFDLMVSVYMFTKTERRVVAAGNNNPKLVGAVKNCVATNF
jgi:hypothetical protein